MKDLVVIMPSFKAGGSQRVLAILMNYIAKSEAKTTLLLLKKGAPVEYPLDKKICIVKNNNCHSNKLKTVISEIRIIRKTIREKPGCNCLSFITMYNLYTIFAAIGLDANVIVSERAAPEKSLPKNSKLLIWLRNKLYQKANCVVFQTQESKQYFDKVKGIKHIIIPNPLSKGLPVKKDYKDALEFVSVARLEKQKNYPLMMDAMDLVVDQYPEAKLLIYGKGSLEQQLSEYHKHIKHPDNVIFKGFTEDVPQALLSAYAFVLSSDYEGLSNSMLEAMAMGVPCICTDCPGGGAKQYIENKITGFLVPPKNKEALAQAMIVLIENPELREKIGTNALYIRDELDHNKVIDKWIRLFS